MSSSKIASPALVVLFVSTLVSGQTKSKAPSFSDTLTWLSGATDTQSGDGNHHHTFESTGISSCSVVITETRSKAGPDFWIKESFSLADIDPDDIQVEDLAKGEFKQTFEGLSAVRFHTTNFSRKILHTSNTNSEANPTTDYIFFTNEWFAPRFAKALKRAAELCGAQPSSF
jgi:hypothetical protein